MESYRTAADFLKDKEEGLRNCLILSTVNFPTAETELVLQNLISQDLDEAEIPWYVCKNNVVTPDVSRSISNFFARDKRGVVFAEFGLIQGMEFDSVLLFHEAFSKRRQKFVSNPVSFTKENRFLRAKYKLAVVNVQRRHSDKVLNLMRLVEQIAESFNTEI